MSETLQKLSGDEEMNERAFSLLVDEMRRMNDNIEKLRDKQAEYVADMTNKYNSLQQQFLISHANLKGDIDLGKVKSGYISVISTILVNGGISAFGWAKAFLNH